MGMFDCIKCELPLPDGWSSDNLQTKDLSSTLVTNIITKDGRLLVDVGEDVVVPPAERPYPNAEGIRGIIGMLKHIPKYEDSDYHGVIEFYGSEVVGHTPDERYGPEGRPVYVEHGYRAKFTNGQLDGIELIKVET